MKTSLKTGILVVALLTFLVPVFSRANTYFPNVQVHSGNPGTINLAPYTGTTSSVVVLKITNNGGSNGNLALRKTGDGGTFTVASTHVGGSGALFVNGRSHYLTGVTDTNGSIDIVGSAFTWTVVLEAYTLTSTSTGSGSSTPLTQEEFDEMLDTSMDTTNSVMTLLGGALLFLGSMGLIMFYFKNRK